MSDEANQPLPKVLIVDDSRMVRASLIKLIRGRFEFREEADGEAGWQALLVDPTIHLVLTDIGMPQLDGYGLLERIRGSRLSRIHELPVIVISGDEDDSARERARQLGANDFITKGIGAAELLARLDSLTRLAQTRRALEESREALAKQSPVDPVSGLATESYMNWRGEQELALARRRQGDIGAMIVEIDRYEQLVDRHGDHVAQLVTRKLSRILATKVRKEDTVAQLGSAQFAILSPSTELIACCAFALRLQKAMEKLVMTYRDERIRISVTIGVSSSTTDPVKTVSDLIGLAVQRARSGRDAGGNRVIGGGGEVRQEFVDRHLKQTVSIDQVLARLRLGETAELRGQLPVVVATLLPLLELVESQLRCGIPIDALRKFDPDAGRGSGSAAKG
ncbi:MAG: diguanylate cyclase [Aromatoleum sp.]|jgi:diguanylate cyclase (GGDEF)-like protein|uniref:GGDEF domain-containing response regulator n=1 Tax=Aromatoleum sp. TaxID=2307007 RepID=UPI002895D61F|nr:diguanylate cyclase [Aromatoleum sp.]MDT3672829.1 diguanylate cyclase [Aromatoleum sp.]